MSNGCRNPALDFVWDNCARHFPPADAPEVACGGCGRSMPVAGGKAVACAIEAAWSRSFPSRNPAKKSGRLGSPTNLAFFHVEDGAAAISSSARIPLFEGLELHKNDRQPWVWRGARASTRVITTSIAARRGQGPPRSRRDARSGEWIIPDGRPASGS